MSMPFKIDSTPGSSNVNTPLPSYPPSVANASQESLSEKVLPPPDYTPPDYTSSSNSSTWDIEAASIHTIKIEASSSPEFVDHGIIDRVLSRVSTKEPGPPPNGGWNAWSMVLIGHLIIFNTWGYINSFGLFQAYYVEALGRSPSDIAWVGSIQIWLTFSLGAIAGRATDAGYFKFIITLGLTLQLIGIFGTSFATEYWQMFLAQGICQGIGCGLCFCSTVTVVSTYFTTKRSLAIASTACGAATGGIVFPLIAQQLLEKIGFGWTIRVMGFVAMANASVAIAFARARVPPRRSGPFIEWSAFKEVPFVIFNIGAFLILWGVYVAYYYVKTFAHDVLQAPPATSFALLIVINATGIPGRLIPALISDRVLGPLSTFIPVVAGASILFYSWAAVDSITGLFIFAGIYGFFGGGIQSLFPTASSSLTPDLQKRGVRMGMMFSIVSFATLTGPPLAGALIEKSGGSYLHAQIFGGTALAAGMLMLGVARFVCTGKEWKQKL